MRPGEISLAHGGCLFLDELAEFPSGVLQMLRQPLEEGVVRIVRADGMYIFPSRFQLIAASNPCPCGYLGDREVACTCSATAIERYRSKLAGPLSTASISCSMYAGPIHRSSSRVLRVWIQRGFPPWSRPGGRSRWNGETIPSLLPHHLEHRSIGPLQPSIWIAMQRMRSWGYLNATSLPAAVSSAFAG